MNEDPSGFAASATLDTIGQQAAPSPALALGKPAIFQQTQEQEIFADALRAFFGDHKASPGRGFNRKLWRDAAREIDLMSAFFPSPDGDFSSDFADASIVMELIGGYNLPIPFLETILMAGSCIAASDRCDFQALTAEIIRGEALVAPAWRDGELPCRAESLGGGAYLLSGTKTMVRWASDATHFLIFASVRDDPSELGLFLVPAASAGVMVDPATTIDGVSCGNVRLDCAADADMILIGPDRAEHALTAMLLTGDAALCAEAVGLMRSMLEQCLAHLKTRQQFGAPLFTFQVVQHRFVDLRIAFEHAQSVTTAAIHAISRDASDKALIVAFAQMVTMSALGQVARQTVQLHGAVGLMDETPISHLFRRSIVLRDQLLGRSHHRQLIERNIGTTIPSGPSDRDLVGELRSEDGSDREFRREVADFLKNELSDELRKRSDWSTSSFGDPDATLPWLSALNRKGWAAPGWPIEHGGTGWTTRQRQIFEEEISRHGAPRLPAMSLSMIGPVLIKFGTPAQKARFLPRILSGEDYWCQGFSEPRAGSDLASLTLRAVRQGDEYVINGSKIWTTHAQHANWIFLLVRTAFSERKQGGISFLLAPLSSAGITVRPLISMSGEHEVNEVFFDDVRIPVANLVGEENQGWKVAKYLLEFERGVGHQVQALVTELNRLRNIACSERDETGRAIWDDPSFRSRYAALEADVLALRLTEERLVYGLPPGQSVGDFTAAIMKLGWSEAGQAIGEAIMDSLGALAGIDQQRAHDAREPSLVFGPHYAATPGRRYLEERVLTIAGGSSEILRTIVAKMIDAGRA